MSTNNPSNSELLDLRRIFEGAELTRDVDNKVWMTQVRDKLFTMFCSHLSDEYMKEAFKWVAELCILTGDFSWISPDGGWSQDDVKIFSCISSRAFIELVMLFPLITRDLTHGHEPEKDEDNRVVERSANDEDYDSFGLHLVILESVIKTLVKGQSIEDDKEDGLGEGSVSIFDNFDKDKLHYILDRLKEVMILNSEYLETVHSNWTSLAHQTDSLKFSASEGSLRVMCVWLSEDPCFQPQKRDFILDLMVKNLMLRDRPLKKDIIVLAMHAICTQDDESHLALSKIKNHKQALESYLEFTENEQDRSSGEPRTRKKFKFRCRMIKDLLKNEY